MKAHNIGIESDGKKPPRFMPGVRKQLSGVREVSPRDFYGQNKNDFQKLFIMV